MAILVSQLANTGAYTLASNDTANKFFGMATIAETLNFSGTGNLEILDISDWDVLNLTSIDPTQQTINIKKSGNSVILTVGTQTFTLGALADGEHVTVNLGSGGTPPSLAISRTGNNFFYGGSSAIIDTDTTLSFATVTTTAAITGVTDNVGLVTGTLNSGGVTDDISLSLVGTISATLSAGQVVAIYDGATRLGTATVSTTNWTYADTRTLTNAQALIYTAQVETTTGLQGTASSAFTLTVDTQASTTTSTITTISDDTGTASDFSTSTASQTISGALTANLAADETVQVSFGSNWENAAAIVGQNTWSAANQTLLLGTNTFHARVVDAAGNIGNETTQNIALVPKITWAGTGFTEATANDGTIDAAAITATVANATLNTGLSASDFTVTGLPAGLSLSVARTSGTVASFTLTGTATTHENTNDVSNLTIAFKDSAFDSTTPAGVISAATAEGGSSNLTIDFADATPVPAVVTGVTSSKTNGSYKAGEVIDITVTFDKAVTVTTTNGTPTLQLSTGGTPNATVNYASGSGSTTLTFNYTVGAGEHTADLNYLATNSLALNGGTINDANGANGAAAVLTLPATSSDTSLGGSKAIVIDTVVPNAPTGLDLATEDDTGAVTNDNITKNTASLTITGAGETDATIELFNDADSDGVIDTGESLGTATVTTGTWTKDISLTASATPHSIKAIQTDVAGNVSAVSTALSVTIDTGLPAVTTLATGSQPPASKFEETWDGTTYTNLLTLNGSGFLSLLASGSATGSVLNQLDWFQLTWDTNSDGTTTANVNFTKETDIVSANVMSDTTVEIVLTETGRTKINSNTTADTLTITNSFWVDNAGNIQTVTGGELNDLLDDVDRSLGLNITTTGTKTPVSGADLVTVVSSETITLVANNLSAATKLTVDTLATGKTLTLDQSNKIATVTAGADNAGGVIASLDPTITTVFIQGGTGNNQLGFGSTDVRAFGSDGVDLFIAQNLPITNPYQIFTFTSGQDHIQFTLSQLTAVSLEYVPNTTHVLTAGTTIDTSNFVVQTDEVDGNGDPIVLPAVATAAYAQFLFDTDTGTLSFDPDGTTATSGGHTAQEPIALITGLPTDFAATDITLFAAA